MRAGRIFFALSRWTALSAANAAGTAMGNSLEDPLATHHSIAAVLVGPRRGLPNAFNLRSFPCRSRVYRDSLALRICAPER